MSRQSKQARKALVALKMKGAKGPAKTTPLHGKKPGNRSKWNRADRKEGKEAVAADKAAEV